MNKYLIYKSGKYYNIINNELNELSITTLTSQDFIDYGNDEAPNSEILKSIEELNLLCWSDDTSKKFKAIITGLPYPQSIISGSMDFTDTSITGIESVEIEDTGEPLYAVSFDSGNSWFMMTNNGWAEISGEHNGMKKDVFTAITTQEWSEKIVDSTYGKIRASLFTAEDSVKSVKVNYTN